MQLTLAALARATGGALRRGDPGAVATSFAIDSRALEPGACFVALRGERDGHDFVADAWRRGAAAAVVSAEHAGRLEVEGDGPLLVVADPLRAIGDLGRAARRALEPVTVVGITGSTGKTSTKDLTAAAVGAARPVHASPASYNNEAGVPLTLLGAAVGDEVVVVEMGARAAGNIAALCEVARPGIGVVTQIGLAHAALLGDREATARVKGELLEALPATGVAVLNADDDMTPRLRARTAAAALTVGTRAAGVPAPDVLVGAVRLDAELRPSFELATPWGGVAVALEARGRHQALNAGLAVAVAGALGVPPEAAAAGMRRRRIAPGRMELVTTPEGAVVIDDTYNANPTSVRAALEALAALEVVGRRIVVLGPMLELGDHAVEEHARAGALAAARGIDVLVAVGDLAAPAGEAARDASERITVLRAADAPAAAALVRADLGRGDAVLVKASRAAHLEDVVHDLVVRPVAATSNGVADA